MVSATDTSIKNLAIFWKQNLEFSVISIMIGTALQQLYDVTRCGLSLECASDCRGRQFVWGEAKKSKKWCILVHYGAFSGDKMSAW